MVVRIIGLLASIIVVALTSGCDSARKAIKDLPINPDQIGSGGNSSITISLPASSSEASVPPSVGASSSEDNDAFSSEDNGAASSEAVVSSSSVVVTVGSSSSANSTPVIQSSSSVFVGGASSSLVTGSSAAASSSSTVVNPSSSMAASSSEADSSSSESDSALYSVELSANCTRGMPLSGDVTVVFEEQENDVIGGLEGFNYIVDTPPYTNLQSGPTSPLYAIPGTAIQDPSCDGAQTIRSVLVKKLGDGTRSYGNGIDVSVTNENKVFSDPLAIVLTLKVNRENTALPTSLDIAQSFPALTADEVQQLDQSEATLGISLLSPRTAAERGEGTTDVVAERYIDIEPQFFDQWVDVRIPFEHMIFYSTIKRAKELRSREVIASANVDTIQIVAETWGNRREDSDFATFGYVVSDFNKAIGSELFKEVDISIKRVVIEWQ